jgi:hypothetical protein
MLALNPMQLGSCTTRPVLLMHALQLPPFKCTYTTTGINMDHVK